MSEQWQITSDAYGNCNCLSNCGCQFNLPSSHGFCQFVEAGEIIEGHYGDTSLKGLKWAFMMIWPGEIAEGNGKQLVVIDEAADADQRDAMNKIISGAAGEPGSNHFSVFGSTCSQALETLYLPIEYSNDIAARTAHFNIPGMLESVGSPLINDFNGEEFHIALARTKGSFEFTYAELGQGKSKVTGPMAMEFDGTFAQFNMLHYDQNGLVAQA